MGVAFRFASFGVLAAVVNFSAVNAQDANSRETLKATTKTQGDFNLSHRISVAIDGTSVRGVNSIEGIETESEVVAYKDGDDSVVRTRPGNHKPGRISITKDWSNTSEFFQWRKAVLDGKVDRKSVSVIFHNDAGEESGRILFNRCWPSKWSGPALNARNSGHASEKLDLVCESIEIPLNK